jgi:FtsP/CotA-like multicopper oxidase with cupredoxin domain
MPRRAILAGLLAFALVASTAASAAVGGRRGSGGPWEGNPPTKDVSTPRGEEPCPNEHTGWREAQTVMGVDLQADPQCQPDNPELVASFVEGTNNVNQSTLDDLALNDEAVVKCCDEDDDGDPDVVNITLEILEINGFHLQSDDLAVPFNIAPGIHPSFWVFAPKGTIEHAGEAFRDIARMPSPPIRAEVGDQVNLEIENTHYFPHTVHLHGVDHGYQDDDGEGNDGVPVASEAPIRPGESRTYEFQPRQAGTMYYHCHVQPQAHVLMGLNGIMRIEPERDDNTLQTVNPGAGLVRHPSQSVQDNHTREYDYHYQNVDADLHEIPKSSNDPRVIAERMNREFDATDREADYFLLNGRSFPYTLRESNIVLDDNETALVHVLNGGEDTHSIHTHGHKPTVQAQDGIPVPEDQRTQRDVFTLTAAQRLDLVVDATNDGTNSYAPGVWFMHDHVEDATTTDGINPGGDVSLITYEDYLDNETGMPQPGSGSWDLFFTEEYYSGEIPVWHDLDMPWIFGEANTTSADTDADSEASISAPNAIGLTVGLLAAALLARTRGEKR